MEVASGLAGGTLMTVAGQTMLAVAGQTMTDAPSVIIIGAGPSGIAMAYKLKYDLGFDDFTIYDKAGEIGGLDEDELQLNSRNSFPSSLHCFSFHQHYAWTRHNASSKEILAYLNDTVDKFGLRQHIHCSVEPVKAHWIDDKNVWRIQLRDLQTGIEFNRYSTVLISAAGLPEQRAISGSSNTSLDRPRSTVASILSQYIPLVQRVHRFQAYVQAELNGTDDSSAHEVPIDVPQSGSDGNDFEIIGSRDGVSLSQYWKETRKPQAYWGCLVASFPNFGLILGPNSYPARNSPFVAIEVCVSYLSRNLVSPILDNRATRVEVRQAAEDRWTSSLFMSHPIRKQQDAGLKEEDHKTYAWPHSMTSFYIQSLLYGSRGLVYRNGQTGWWMNMFVRWAKSIRLRTWLTLLLVLVSLRAKTVKARVDRARADVEKYVPYERQALELAGKLKESLLK